MIILLALVPVAVLHGESGAFLPSIALSYGLAIVASVLVALVATPALSSLLLGGCAISAPHPWSAGCTPGTPPGHGAASPGYASRAGRDLVGLVVVGIVSLPLLDHESSLVPSLPGSERARAVEWRARDVRSPRWTGSRHGSCASCGRSAGSVTPAVTSAGPCCGDQVVDTSAGELWVTLDDGADYDATLAAIRRGGRRLSGDRSRRHELPEPARSPTSSTGRATT